MLCARAGAVLALLLAAMPFFVGCQPQPGDRYADAEMEYTAIIEGQLEIQSTPTESIPEELGEMRAENSDVCGWLLVPGTDVTMPVVQEGDREGYYLTHAWDGAYSPLGSAFVERGNASDFSDPVTIVYGHSSKDVPLLFSQLHDYEEKGFFEENGLFFIYVGEEVLMYEIVSACLFNDDHILNSIDFGDPTSMEELFDYVSKPNGHTVGNWALGMDLDPGKDRLVMLSTCQVPPVEGTRFVVTGVLRAKVPAFCSK